MPYEIFLAWRGLRSRLIQTIIPILIVAVAITLSVTVLLLSDGVRQGIIQASDPFGMLVIGAKGDSQQLVLNTLLLQGDAIGTIPYAIYETLQADERVAFAVPLAKGDNVGGAPLIGTDQNFFELRTARTAPPAFQIAQGRVFATDFEAVLGSQAAIQLGLGIGDEFQSAHGFGRGLASDIHEQRYTIVGILAPSGTPYDRVVLTTLASLWEVHEAPQLERGIAGALVIEDDHAADEGNLTAVLVLPVGFVEQNQLWQDFFTGTVAQAAFPGQELGGLFDLLRQGERILTAVGYLVLGMALLTMFLSVYSTTQQQQREIAIMRSLGSDRAMIFRVILWQTLLMTLLGIVLGRILGFVIALIFASMVTQQSAIALPIRPLTEIEPLLWFLPLGGSIIAGLLPAINAYRVDVVEHLFGS